MMWHAYPFVMDFDPHPATTALASLVLTTPHPQPNPYPHLTPIATLIPIPSPPRQRPRVSAYYLEHERLGPLCFLCTASTHTTSSHQESHEVTAADSSVVLTPRTLTINGTSVALRSLIPPPITFTLASHPHLGFFLEPLALPRRLRRHNLEDRDLTKGAISRAISADGLLSP